MSDKNSFNYSFLIVMMIGLPAGQVLVNYTSNKPIIVTDVLLHVAITLVIFGFFELYRAVKKTWGFWGCLGLASMTAISILVAYKYFFGSPVAWLKLVLVGMALGLTPTSLVMWARSKEKDEESSANDA